MSPKAIGIVLLAMSGSFVTILAVLGYAVSNEPASRPVRRPRTEHIAAPPPVLRSHPTDAPETFTPDVPDQPQPLSDSDISLPPAPAPAPQLAQLARTTQRRLQGVEDALARQVAALKQSRDEMLDELAAQLAAIPVDEATQTLKPLDDETAALTLTRLGTARRKAILRALPDKRRATLEKRLRQLQK